MKKIIPIVNLASEFANVKRNEVEFSFKDMFLKKG